MLSLLQRSEGESSPANPPLLLGSAAFAASVAVAAAGKTDLAATAFDTPLTALRDRSGEWVHLPT